MAARKFSFLSVNRPAYTLADRSLYCATGRHSFDLKIGNLFGKICCDRAGLADNVAFLASPLRHLAPSMRAAF